MQITEIDQLIKGSIRLSASSFSWLLVVDIRLLELLDRAKCEGITQSQYIFVRKFWIFPLAAVCGASVWSDEKGGEGHHYF